MGEKKSNTKPEQLAKDLRIKARRERHPMACISEHGFSDER